MTASTGSRGRGPRRATSREQRARRLAVSLAILVAAIGIYVFVLSRGAIL